MQTTWLWKRWFPLGLNAAVLAISLGVLLWLLSPSSDMMALHYTIYFGVDFLSAWWWPYLWLGLLTLLTLLHVVLAWYLRERQSHFASLFLWWSALLSLVFGIGLFWTLALITTT